jgi:hypothetical protein
MANSVASPQEQLQRDISSAQFDLRNLIEKVKLTSVRDRYSALDADINNLPTRVQKIRDRKYPFNKILEEQARNFQRQWAIKRGGILNQITQESTALQNQLRPLEARVSALSAGSSTSATVSALRSQLSSFSSKVSSAESAVNGMFDDLNNDVSSVETQLSRIEKTLDYCDSASFGFLPTESIVRAVKATWTRDEREDKEDPEGILFLTDQRLIFEQREEIATKKVLFITTERKKVQELEFEVPVVSISSIKATKQGLLKNEDWLDLELESGAFARSAKLHIDGQSCNEWQALITQAKSRDLDADRAFAIDQSAVEKVKSAPVICPSCGATLSKPVLRGMDTITCEFCGRVIKL